MTRLKTPKALEKIPTNSGSRNFSSSIYDCLQVVWQLNPDFVIMFTPSCLFIYLFIFFSKFWLKQKECKSKMVFKFFNTFFEKTTYF